MPKGFFSKILICLIIAANIVFTGAIMTLFAMTGAEPSSLVVAWFAFTTGELWALAMLKIKKNKDTDAPEDNDNYEQEDDSVWK